jgi:hypothetical protein
MADKFAKFPSSMDSPAKYAFAITGNNSANLANTVRSVYVGGTGDVKCELAGDPDGSFVVFTAVPVGMVIPARIRKVYATGTTATNLIGLY